MDVVATRDLRKSYGDVEALRGVDLAVRSGETFGLLGPNGAGKTTLQQILCTLVPPTSGEAFVDGVDVVKNPTGARRSLGVVFQVPTLDPIFSAEENLRIHGRLYKVGERELDERIPDLLELAQLAERRRDPVNTFSGGMKRRLEIVRALLHRPRILLLDEPTIGLDPQSRRLIWERIELMKKEYGITVLLTTHYMDEADRLCDRIAVIDHGSIVALDSPETLKSRLGGDRLELTLGAPANGLAEDVRALPNVIAVDADGMRMLVRLREATTTIPAVMQLAARRNVPVVEMRHAAQTMDDVFLGLTGRVRDHRKKARRTWRSIVDTLFGGGGGS